MARTVMAFGTFDTLHYGHVSYLNAAKRYGDRLVVIIARDKSVELMKHRKPIFDERTRLRMVRALKPVDEAVLGNKLSKASDRYAIIKRYRPAVIVLGYDQVGSTKPIEKWLKENGLRTKVMKLNRGVDVDIFKSSAIRKRLLRSAT